MEKAKSVRSLDNGSDLLALDRRFGNSLSSGLSAEVIEADFVRQKELWGGVHCK